jgi:hypothetical protein
MSISVFSGATGEAIYTTNYVPERAIVGGAMIMPPKRSITGLWASWMVFHPVL